MIVVCFIGISTFGLAAFTLLDSLGIDRRTAAFLPVLFYTVSLAFVLPLLYGLIRFEIKTFEREKTDVRELFYAFSSPDNLSRAYKLFVSFFARFALCFAPAAALMYFLNYYYYSGIFGIDVYISDVDLVFYTLNIVFVLIFLLSFAYSTRFFVSAYVAVKREDIPIGKCFFVGSICCNGKKHELFVTALSFLPLAVISLFTVGFLFVIYTFPYIFLTFTGFSSYLYLLEQESKRVGNLVYENDGNNEDEQDSAVNQ